MLRKFIQYQPANGAPFAGHIDATVVCDDANTPPHANQIAVDVDVVTQGMQIDVTQDPPAIIALLPQNAPPAAIVQPSPTEWLERLSADKQLAIAAASISIPAVHLWVLKAAGDGSIDVTAQQTKDGVAALVAAGVLTADDQTILLTP